MRQHELESETAGQERAAQCRRCKRHTLRTTASRAAGIGPRCAAIEAALAGLKPEQQAKALEAVADKAVQRTGHQGVFAVSSSSGVAAYLVSVKGPCNCSNGLHRMTDKPCWHVGAARLTARPLVRSSMAKAA